MTPQQIRNEVEKDKKYKLEMSNNGIEHITKDGHIMFMEDVVKDLNNNHSLTEDKFALGEGCKNDNGLQSSSDQVANTPIKEVKRGCKKVWFGKDQLEHYCGYDCLCEECQVLEQMDLYLTELKKALERNDYGFAEVLNISFGKYLENLK